MNLWRESIQSNKEKILRNLEFTVRKDAIDHVETHEKETACLLWLSQHAHQESSHNGSLLFFSGPQ